MFYIRENNRYSEVSNVVSSKRITISSKTLIFILVGILLILIAGFRPIGIDRDSLNYVRALNEPINFLDKEPFFWIIRGINKILFSGSARTFFLIFAIISIGLKVYIIKQYSVTPMLSLLTYISMFFILQDMTEIRRSVAIGFGFWALYDLSQKRNISFLIEILIAILFHYSAFFLLFIYFLSARNKINSFFYFSLPLVGLVSSCTNIPVEIMYKLVSILPNFLSHKIHIYLSLMEQNKTMQVNPVNIGNLFLLLIYYFNLYIASTKQYFYLNKEYYLLCIKILGFGFFILFSFSFLEVFAYRIANYAFFSLVFFIVYHSPIFPTKKIIYNTNRNIFNLYIS